MTENHRIEYNWIKSVETLEEYQPGGYHPIMVGDVLHGRYHIADKLGFGGYSTFWLAQDMHLKRYVAVKVNIADSIPRETTVLKALSTPLPSSSPLHLERGLLPVVHDEFKVHGPNGEHACYTLTPAQCNYPLAVFSLSKLLEHYRMDLYRPLLIHTHRAMFMEVCRDEDDTY
jgi:serine/threonine protein kinase